MTVLLIGLLNCLALSSPENAEVEILGKYFDAAERQQNALRGIQMEVSIDASLPKLAKRAHLTVLRASSELGQISYKVLASSGDRTVRQEVIARYLAADRESRDPGTVAIIPANYRFRLKGAAGSGTRLVYIFQLTPRKKTAGLFKGELCVDGETGMPLRESGQLVKNPSMFIKRMRFVREYELRGGIAFPKSLEGIVESRLVGRAELRIEFGNFVPPASGEIDAVNEECKRH